MWLSSCRIGRVVCLLFRTHRSQVLPSKDQPQSAHDCGWVGVTKQICMALESAPRHNWKLTYSASSWWGVSRVYSLCKPGGNGQQRSCKRSAEMPDVQFILSSGPAASAQQSPKAEQQHSFQDGCRTSSFALEHDAAESSLVSARTRLLLPRLPAVCSHEAAQTAAAVKRASFSGLSHKPRL